MIATAVKHALEAAERAWIWDQDRTDEEFAMGQPLPMKISEYGDRFARILKRRPGLCRVRSKVADTRGRHALAAGSAESAVKLLGTR